MTTIIIALIVAGLLLLWLEMIIPGMVAGSIGGLSLASGVTLAYIHEGFGAGNLALLCAMVGIGFLMFWWGKYFQHTAIGKKMILSTPHTGSGIPDDLSQLVGKSGKAVTPLRPSGMVMIDGRRLDAKTGGEWIETEIPVHVVSVQSGILVVKTAAA